MALNSLLCADVPLRNCSINQSMIHVCLIFKRITQKGIGRLWSREEWIKF